MDKFERVYGFKVVRYRWWLIAVTLLLIAWAGYGGQYLKFTSDYRVYFKADNPQLQAFEAIEKTYSKNDSVIIVLTPHEGDVFTSNMLDLVERTTRKAWQTPYSSRVDSITNFQYTEADGDDVVVRDLVRGGAGFSAQQLDEARQIALQEPAIVGSLLSTATDVTAIQIKVRLPGIDEEKEVPEVVAYVRAMVAEIERDYSAVDVHLTGIVLMDNAFAEASQLDMATLIPMSFVVMIIALGLLIKAYSATLTAMTLILFSIIAAMGLAGYLAMPITPTIIPAPIIILTVAIANSVHILVSFYDQLRLGLTKPEAINESLRVNLQPVILTSVTTAIGFLTMNFSEVPPFQHLGNLVATGVLVVLVLSLTFLPAMLAVLPIKVEVRNESAANYMVTFSAWVVKRNRILLVTMSVLVVAMAVWIPKNELNDNFVEYFDESVEFRTDTDYANAHLTGLYSFSYSLDSGEQGGINQPEFLADVESFKLWLEKQPEVLHVSAITSVFKRLNQNMNGDAPEAYKLPESRELAAQYLLLYEMSLPYGMDLNDRINVDKSTTLLHVSLKTLTTKQVLALEARSLAWLHKNAAHVADVKVASPDLMFAYISSLNIISMLTGTTLALVMISLILIVALRSVKIGLISLIPNLVPAAMAFGLWGLYVGEVGLALSVVMGMTLGIVVDDTVHFLSKYLRARREKMLSAQEAVSYAFKNVGRALLFTSFILTVGFLILATSDFKLNSDMGLLSAIVIVMALIADFFLLPALLIKLDRDEAADHAAKAN